MFEELMYKNGKWYINKSLDEKNWKIMRKSDLARRFKELRDEYFKLAKRENKCVG